MKYVIGEIPPSWNRYAGRQNAWEYRREKKRWEELVMLCCAKKPDRPIERARVTITYYFPDRRRRDPDNYCGKMILDGLTRAGILEDDDFSHIELTIRSGGADRENPRTEIEIEEG